MSITLQSETTKPLLSLPPQTLLTGPHSVLSKFYTQPNHPPTYPYPESPLASSATLCKYMPSSARSTDKSSVGKTDLGRTQSYLPAKDSPQQTIVNGPTSAKSKRTNSNLISNKSAIYHTLPIVKRTPKLLSLPMDRDSLEIDTPPCGIVTTPPKSPGILKRINTLASSGDDNVEISDAIINTASCSINITTNNAVDATATVSTANTAATTPTNTTAAITATTKIFNAVRNNSCNTANETKSQAKTKPPCSPSKRPVFLNLTSNIGTSKLRQGRAVKPSSVNYSLPESPVCDELNSPTALFQNLTDSESAARHSKLLQTRRSCSYFIDLNTLSDKDQEFKKDAKVVAAKSSESLPATIGQTNASSSENLLDSCDEEDDGAGNFSSDSLEEPSEFSSRTPRRCVSDYQIFTKPHRQYMERRLSSAADRHKGLTSCSQESILSDTSGQLSSSGDILEMCEEEQDRHSSASFFLSLRHGTSQESILGEDCTQPRYRRDSCRSTEGILETGDFHHRELQARHRDSCQSTESVLTDDSDFQRGESCGFVNKGFGIAAGVYSRQCRGSIPPSLERQENPSDSVEENRHRTIFRTRSLQDTRSKTLVVETTGLTVYSKPPIAPSSRPQTPSKRVMKGENLMSQFSEPTKPPIPTYRKNSYPRSRPQTPTSIIIQPQIKMAVEGSDLNGPPLSPSYMNTRASDSCQESPCNSLSEESKPKSNLGSYRPPTAPKPVGKIAHKPPPKPRQKPPPHSVARENVTKLDVGRNSDGDNGSTLTNQTNNERKSLSIMNSSENERQLSDGENTIKNLSDTANLIKRLSGQLKETMRNKVGKQTETKGEIGGTDAGCVKIRPSQRPDVIPSVGVKLLRKSFENVLEDAEVSDLEEDSFPMAGGGSGSSTPATSSSAANSPKRAWPPASRAPVQRHHLAKQLLPSKYSAVSGKANKPVSGTRTLPRHSSKQASSSNSNIMRSTSMGVLNQSDSESDLSLQRSSMAARLNGLMRPTISSQNKVNTLSVKNASSNSQSHRRGMRPSYSSVNLSQVGNNEDSSSEETSSARGKSSTSSRPRSTSTDRLTNGAPNSLPLSPDSQLMPPPRRLAGGASSRQRSAASGSASAGGRGSKPVPAVRQHQLDPSPQELPVKDTDGQSPFVDVASAPLSQQLCSSVAEQLTRTADSVVQLYKRLAVEGDDNATAATAMLQALEEAVAETQRTLRLVTEPAPSPDQTSPVSQSTSPSGPESQEQKKVMVMMQQYSDMLLSMVHQRMNSAAQQKPS
ncbi:uncharacterized protein LOC126285454 isoform X4 [Schistocerca gregaria]|uniref:uncharacterized protein LOC126285454 isoform X4 n=1 Tax=Schistocerca gregaria TaxID=7010 RepID=UPI00211F46F1|nr:uncharacterized protein LOC126285454 isoform X4 [Schistocerca gregaria]